MYILILTGKFGMGHWSASQSLAQQLRAAFPGARVEVEDLISRTLPDYAEAVYGSFRLLVTHGRGLYNVFYRLSEHEQVAVPSPVALAMAAPLARLLRERRPDAVVVTHPLCAQAMSQCKDRPGLSIPLVTCVTDVTDHAEWLTPRCDAYLVPAPEVRDAFVKKGVPRERILVTGIPVRQEFKLPPRRAEDGERRLLIMGGGLGMLPGDLWFYEALDRFPHIHVTVLTGGNQKLLERLHGRFEHIEAVGFTDRVYEYMSSAHLMLTKPGGITLFEAIFSRLPILAWTPTLAQERHNADFLLRAGIGRLAGTEPETCLEAIRDLLYDPAALDAMGWNMEALQAALTDRGPELLMAALERQGEAVA